jgi:hypothetical protein
MCEMARSARVEDFGGHRLRNTRAIDLCINHVFRPSTLHRQRPKEKQTLVAGPQAFVAALSLCCFVVCVIDHILLIAVASFVHA